MMTSACKAPTASRSPAERNDSTKANSCWGIIVTRFRGALEGKPSEHALWLTMASDIQNNLYTVDEAHQEGRVGLRYNSLGLPSRSRM